MADQSPKVTLLRGSKLRCPACEAEGDASYHFRPLDLNERYEPELVRIYQHRRDRGGCGHLFAPLALSRAGGFLQSRDSREEVRI
jgi:hypothetical protein